MGIGAADWGNAFQRPKLRAGQIPISVLEGRECPIADKTVDTQERLFARPIQGGCIGGAKMWRPS